MSLDTLQQGNTQANQLYKVLSEYEKQEKKEKIEHLYYLILKELGIDCDTDQHTKDTPKRLAKMYLDEVMSGRYTELPKITTFDATHQELVVVKDIEVRSMCSHHFVPIIGKAHIGYIPDKKVVGLSKFARIIEHFSRRPQIQEELTNQIFTYLEELLEPLSLYLIIEAEHYCMIWRGVKNMDSETITSQCSKSIKQDVNLKNEYLRLMKG